MNKSEKLLKTTKKCILKTLEDGLKKKKNRKPQKGKSVWPRTLVVINRTTKKDHFLIPSVVKKDVEIPCCTF